MPCPMPNARKTLTRRCAVRSRAGGNQKSVTVNQPIANETANDSSSPALIMSETLDAFEQQDTVTEIMADAQARADMLCRCAGAGEISNHERPLRLPVDHDRAQHIAHH